MEFRVCFVVFRLDSGAKVPGSCDYKPKPWVLPPLCNRWIMQYLVIVIFSPSYDP